MTDKSLPLSSSTTEMKRRRPERPQDRLAGDHPTLNPICEARGPKQTFTGPTDRLGFYILIIIGMIGVALVCRIQIAYSPSVWAHFFIALPPVLLACGLPIWLLNNWLAKSRFGLNADEPRIDHIRSEPRDGTQAAADFETANRKPVAN